MSHDDAVVTVLMTAPGTEVAETVVRGLLDERLVACGNVLPGAFSIYRWRGEIHRDAEAEATEIGSATGGRTLGVEMEATDAASVEAAVAGVVEQLGGLDILVNNAGILVRGAIGDLEPAQFEESLAVNVTGPWLVCRAAAPHLWESGCGRVINMSSTFGLVAAPDRTAYTSSKGAIVQLTRALAMEWAPRGVNVNTIAPGPFLTDMNRAHQHSEHSVRVIGQEVALQRWGELHEIAGAVIYLASDASSYVTGSVLTVDGGWTAH